MPLFHFHVHNGGSDDGPVAVDLPDVSSAWTEAMRFTGEVIRDGALRDGPDCRWRLDVSDDVGFVMIRMDFAATVPLHAGQGRVESGR